MGLTVCRSSAVMILKPSHLASSFLISLVLHGPVLLCCVCSSHAFSATCSSNTLKTYNLWLFAEYMAESHSGPKNCSDLRQLFAWDYSCFSAITGMVSIEKRLSGACTALSRFLSLLHTKTSKDGRDHRNGAKFSWKAYLKLQRNKSIPLSKQWLLIFNEFKDDCATCQVWCHMSTYLIHASCLLTALSHGIRYLQPWLHTRDGRARARKRERFFW